MKTQILHITCRCAASGQTLAQILQSSFILFLKKELRDMNRARK